MKILLKQVESYVVDDEEQAEALIKETKEEADEKGFELEKYSSQKKTKKSKGEIIAEYVVVSVQKVYERERDLF